MIQPAGTKTYKGMRVSLPGSKSYENDDKILKKSGDFYDKGKVSEKEINNKVAEKIESDKKENGKPEKSAGDNKK